MSRRASTTSGLRLGELPTAHHATELCLGGLALSLDSAIHFADVSTASPSCPIAPIGLRPCRAAQASSVRRCAARRSARATSVSVGVAIEVLGKTALPATKRFATSCTRQSLSTTPLVGS